MARWTRMSSKFRRRRGSNLSRPSASRCKQGTHDPYKRSVQGRASVRKEDIKQCNLLWGLVRLASSEVKLRRMQRRCSIGQGGMSVIVHAVSLSKTCVRSRRLRRCPPIWGHQEPTGRSVRTRYSQPSISMVSRYSFTAIALAMQPTRLRGRNMGVFL